MEKDGVVRWRRQDLQRRIAEAFGVEVHERTVGKYLATLGYRRLQVAPAAPENRPGRARGVQKNFRAAVAAVIPDAARGRALELWFQGEPGQKTVRGMVFPANARVGQQGTLTRIWARRGTRPRAPRDTRYPWAFAGSLGPVAGAGSPVRRRLPGPRRCGGAGPARRQHRSDECPPGGNFPARVEPFVGEMIPRIIS